MRVALLVALTIMFYGENSYADYEREMLGAIYITIGKKFCKLPIPDLNVRLYLSIASGARNWSIAKTTAYVDAMAELEYVGMSASEKKEWCSYLKRYERKI